MKRSRSIALVMMGASTIALTACEEPQVDANIFRDLEQCLDQPGAIQSECEKGFRMASAQHAAVAPKYTDPAACGADFGPGQCEQAPYRSEGGGSIFMPLMMGYMMGSMLGGRSAVAPQPLYRSADDANSYRTADNKKVGANTGATKVARSAASQPTAKPYTMARGGFGSSARTMGSAGA